MRARQKLKVENEFGDDYAHKSWQEVDQPYLWRSWSTEALAATMLSFMGYYSAVQQEKHSCEMRGKALYVLRKTGQLLVGSKSH